MGGYFDIHVLLLTFPGVTVVTEFTIAETNWILFGCQYLDTNKYYLLFNLCSGFLNELLKRFKENRFSFSVILLTFAAYFILAIRAITHRLLYYHANYCTFIRILNLNSEAGLV